jgi:hypothetical protein
MEIAPTLIRATSTLPRQPAMPFVTMLVRDRTRALSVRRCARADKRYALHAAGRVCGKLAGTARQRIWMWSYSGYESGGFDSR